MSALALAAVTFGVGALQSWQQYQSGQYAKEAAAVTATSLRREAQYTEQTVGEQIQQQEYEAQHALASATAGVAASNIVETEGSPELIRFTSANQQRLNDMYTKYAANVQAAGLKTQANIEKAMGEQTATGAEAGATLGLVSSGINAWTGYKYGYNPFAGGGPSTGASLGYTISPAAPTTPTP